MADKITETGPQNFTTIKNIMGEVFGGKDNINTYLTKQARLDWINNNADKLKGANTVLGVDGSFADTKVERKFRNTQFAHLFKDDPELEEHKKLSPAERDRMYVRYARTLNERQEDIQKEQQEQEADLRMARYNASNPAYLRGQMEYVQPYVDESTGTFVIGDPMEATAKADKEAAQQKRHILRDRYINDYDGTKRENDITTAKKVAPQLSQTYAELAGKDFQVDDIDWESFAPEMMWYLENGNELLAGNALNSRVNWALSNNQTFGEAALNWGTRFVSNVGLMAVDLAGLVGGVGESLIGDIMVPWVSGDKIDWAQAGSTLLYDNTLANWSSDAQEYLRNEMPIYTATGVNEVLLDPESSAFMASMVIPGSLVTRVGRGAKIAGKTGKELARAQRWNKLSGYAKDYEKAGKELEKVLKDPNHVSYRRLQELGREAEYNALKEGRSVAQAQKEAREIQQAALTDIYRRGTIQRNQIRLSSILEGQQEALGTKKESLNEFDEAWNRKVYQLTEAALRGEINTEDWEYYITDVEKWQNTLFNDADYMQAVTQSLQKMANEQGYTLSEADAIHYVNEWINKEAVIRAQLDNRLAKERADYDKLASDQANLSGMLTFANNYILLRFSEGLGGWTTRVPTYNRMAPLAGEHKSFLNKTKEALGGISSFGSETANMGSRIGFNEVGQAVRKITPKSIAQTVGRVGGTMGVEIGQELMQELYSSSNIGTSAWNAEAFLTNHFDGQGKDVVDQEYQSQLLAFIRHAGYGKDWNDYAKIIKSTAAQMFFGVPSISKYRSFSRKQDITGKKHIDDNIRRGSFESNASYWFRKIEGWTPMNSPTAQSISQVLNTNSSVNAFINTYNALLDDSRAYCGYASSSLNYAARAFDAANRGDETDYEHSKFAAQVAEAAFMAQLRGKNQQTKMAYYHNLADINTKRQGESDEDFAARRANTLKELREESMYNSLKTASDEELARWAESNGKQMLELIEKAASKSQQLYDQYDGNISWEQVYATIYDDALIDYTNKRIEAIENVYKPLAANITDTEIKDEDRVDENGKPIKLYTESEILRMSPEDRNRIIEQATDKQKTIVDNLINQLEVLNVKNNLGRNVREDFKNVAKEAEIIKNASEEISRLIKNPKQFLDRIKDEKARAAAKSIFNNIKNILSDSELSDTDKRALLSDEMASLSSVNNPQAYMALVEALDTLNAADSKLLNSILIADRANGNPLQNIVNELTKGMSDEEYTNSGYANLLDKIQSSHISFLDDTIRDILNEEEQKLLDNILQRYKEVQDINPHIEIEDGATENSDEPIGESGKPEPISDEEFKQKNIDGIKAHLRIELDKLIQILNVPNPSELKESLESILSGEFDDINDVMLAINKEALHTENSQLKTVLIELAKTLKDYNPDRVDNTRNLATNKLSLANPSMFLNWSESRDGNYAKFYKQYRIIELLRSGQIKVGTPIYVLWDSDFIADTKKMYKESTGEKATQNQIGLVAVVEGSFDGYPTITIGDKTYTRIGLFRAYGKGEHNSRDVVANMISSVTTTPFDERGEIPDIENTIITDKKGKSISFTISALNESALIPTPGVQNSARTLSEERQNVIDSETDRIDTQALQERAKKWFIDNLIIVTNKRGNHLPALRIDRHNTDGYSTIPIQVRSISDTAWQDTTVGQALQDRNVGLISTVNGIPVFNRVAETLKEFMTNPTVQPAIKSFLSELDKLGKKRRLTDANYKKSLEELLTKLNKDCNSLLNSRKGNSLYNRLSIPKDMEYYIDYITEVDETTGETRQYFTLGVKLVQGSHEDAGNIEFMRYEAPAVDGTTELITDNRVVEALANLILNENGEPRKSVGSSDEFVKWQLNYSDIQNRAGIAEELLSDLYDMDVFLIETDNLISSQLDIDILPTDTSIVENTKPQPIGTEGNPDTDRQEFKTSPTENDATKRVDLLQLHITSDTTYTEQIQSVAQQFKWGRESVKLGNVPIRFIGLTEANDLTIIIDDDLNTSENKLAIIEELKKLGVPNADVFNLVNASTYKLQEKSNKEGETIDKKEGSGEIDISMAGEMGSIIPRRPTQPEVSAEEMEAQAKISIRNNLNDHWVADLYDEELYNGEDTDLDRLIDSLAAKYGSYQKAWEVIRKISDADEMMSIFKCV